MSLHIIIDGYNLIRQSHTLSSLDNKDIQIGREALTDMLSAYKRVKNYKITVVFDGTDAPCFLQRQDRIKGIEIKFSQIGEKADAVIKRMALNEREKALVVSSDKEIINFAEQHNSATISSAEFEQKMEMAIYMDMKGSDIKDEYDNGWIPTTKKKGPSKRLSKKERHNRIKTEKL